MSDSESEGRWSDWKSEVAAEPIASFLGPHVHADARGVWQELREATGFDFVAFAAERSLDGYARVRLVNHLRRAAASSVADPAAALRAAVNPATVARESSLWSDEALLQCVLPDDALIGACFEDGDDDGDGGEGAAAATTGEDVRAAAAAAWQAGGLALTGGSAPAMAAAPSDTDCDTVASLRAELQLARALIARLAAGAADEACDRSDDSASSGSRRRRRGTLPARAGVSAQDNDSYYFNSYARSGIHAVSGGGGGSGPPPREQPPCVHPLHSSPCLA
jgi:hypothetical protein